MANSFLRCPSERRLARTLLSFVRRAGLLSLVSSAAVACLDVTNPTVVQDSGIANAAGANGRRLSVVDRINQYFGYLARRVALLTDERLVDRRDPTISLEPTMYLDARNGDQYELMVNPGDDPHLGRLDEIVVRSSIAIVAVQAYTPDSLRGDFLAQLFAFRGFAIIQMGEDICPGFPINDVKDDRPVYSGPFTTDAALTYGLTQLDSALAHAQDSTRYLNLAQVVKGRALLDLGQYAAAAAAVAGVPSTFSYTTDQGDNGGLYVQSYLWQRIPEAVGNLEGGAGLPFVSAQDPRVPTIYMQQGFSDPTDSLFDQLKYPAFDTPVVLASGVEARLIEAEAALAAGDPNWLTILNNLRATAITPAMPPIASAPPTTEAQVDLLYSERAFWLYLTGRRLGDMRRLIRNYGRAPASIFPTGAYRLGGAYGPATAIPFILANQQVGNPNITSGCATN